MEQRPRKALLREELATGRQRTSRCGKHWRASTPKADRWSEPADFGSREKRIQAAQEAIARAAQRHKTDDEKRRDVAAFQKMIRTLTAGAKFGRAESEFALRLRDRGASLTDQSVIAANIAEH